MDGHTFEVMQRMADDPLDECTICSATVQRVFHPVAVHFKGSGFYNTDYGKKKKGAGAANEGGSGSGDDSSSSQSKDDAKKKKESSSSGSASSSGSSPANKSD